MTTQECIAEMLTTSTGVHFLDSGGAYGRNWERNQRAVGESGLTTVQMFEQQPRTELEFWCRDETEEEYSPQVSINVYHFLTEALGEYYEEETHKFWEWAEEPEQEDLYWPGLMEKWLNLDDTRETWGTINTYNGECLVSQTLQYCTNGEKTLLQIHGGCDVRGGYTAPRIFEADPWSEGYLRVADADVFPEYVPEPDTPKLIDVPQERYNVGWHTDDGWHWYPNDRGYNGLRAYKITLDESKRGAGFVWVDEDRNGYCPITGHKLVADFCAC